MSEVNLSISNSVIQSIVEAKINSEVAAALAKTSPLIVENLVSNIVRARVDREGRISKSDYDTMPILDYIIAKEVRRIAEATIVEQLVKDEEKIKDGVRKAITKNVSSISNDLVASLLNSAKGSSLKYNLTVDTEKSISAIEGLKKEINEIKNKINK